MLNKAYLIIGSNLGDRKTILQKSREFIRERIGVIVELSSVYESEPWGFLADEFFLNQVLLVETSLQPEQLLACAKKIEQVFGRRIKNELYQSRELDIDILLYNNEIINAEDLLIIPHREMENRKFVLEPLNEIAGNIIHPVLNKPISQLLTDCPDIGKVVKVGA